MSPDEERAPGQAPVTIHPAESINTASVTTTLFDVAPFQTGPSKKRTTKPKPEPIETVPVIVDATWRAVSLERPGIVHCMVYRPDGFGYARSYCGAGVSPRTYRDGDVVAGCAACIDAGAPWRAQ